MKVLSIILILFYLTLFFSLFSLINNDPCKYKENKDDTGTSTNETTLSGINDLNEKMQKCFSFSHSDIFTKKCCYDKTGDGQCVEEVTGTTTTNIDCPKEGSVYNNCGMAGTYMPLTSAICTEISLVQGYCCYAEFSDGTTACLRTKELNKNKNTATGQMENYLKQVNQSLTIKNVVCKGYNLHHYWIFLIFTVIFLY